MKKTAIVIITLLGISLIGMGLNMRNQGAAYPVYTQSDAPNKVINQIKDFTYVEQVAAWHAGLEQYETPYKKLVDTGESWMMLGIGLLAAVLIYMMVNKGLGILGFMGLWAGLCLIQIPFIVRYYAMRQQRFDYHPSADTVIIPVINESFLVLVSLALSVTIIYFSMRKYQLPASIKLKQVNPTRLMLMGLWLFLLVVSVALGFQDAKLGTILSCTMAIPMVYRMMVAKPK